MIKSSFSWFDKFITCIWICSMILFGSCLALGNNASIRFIDGQAGILHVEKTEYGDNLIQQVVQGTMNFYEAFFINPLYVSSFGLESLLGALIDAAFNFIASLFSAIFDTINNFIDKVGDYLNRFTGLLSNSGPAWNLMSMIAGTTSVCDQIINLATKWAGQIFSATRSPVEMAWHNTTQKIGSFFGGPKVQAFTLDNCLAVGNSSAPLSSTSSRTDLENSVFDILKTITQSYSSGENTAEAEKIASNLANFMTDAAKLKTYSNINQETYDRYLLGMFPHTPDYLSQSENYYTATEFGQKAANKAKEIPTQLALQAGGNPLGIGIVSADLASQTQTFAIPGADKTVQFFDNNGASFNNGVSGSEFKVVGVVAGAPLDAQFQIASNSATNSLGVSGSSSKIGDLIARLADFLRNLIERVLNNLFSKLLNNISTFACAFNFNAICDYASKFTYNVSSNVRSYFDKWFEPRTSLNRNNQNLLASLRESSRILEIRSKKESGTIAA
jgi:hypothetical protein